MRSAPSVASRLSGTTSDCPGVSEPYSAAYFDLVKQAYSSKEACRIVGINPRTGKRWRNGRQPTGNTKGAPPVRPAGHPDVCSRYLGQQERLYIADRWRDRRGSAQSPGSWGDHRRRSAGRSAATGCRRGETSASGHTGPTPRRTGHWPGDPAPSHARSPRTCSCTRSSRPTWTASSARADRRPTTPGLPSVSASGRG